MISKTRKAVWLALFFLIFLSLQADAIPSVGADSEPAKQNQPSQKSSLYEVRFVQLADAKISGIEDSPLSGIILEIETYTPDFNLIIERPSVKISTADGREQNPLLVFLVKTVRGNVGLVARDTKVLRKEISIGDTTYKTSGSTNPEAVKMDDEGRANYVFREKSVIQLAFIFAEDRKNINRLDFFSQAIPINPTD